MRRSLLALAVLVLLLAPGVGCTSPQSPLASENGWPPSLDSTMGPLSVDETATVGPYDVTLTRVRYTEDPTAGPAMPDASPVPPGYQLLDIQVSVRNRAVETSGPEVLPPSMDFRLLDERGVEQAGRGVFYERSDPPPDPSGGLIFSWRSNAPLRPREVFMLTPLFTVPPDSQALTLLWRPRGESRSPVVEFKVK